MMTDYETHFTQGLAYAWAMSDIGVHTELGNRSISSALFAKYHATNRAGNKPFAISTNWVVFLGLLNDYETDLARLNKSLTDHAGLRLNEIGFDAIGRITCQHGQYFGSRVHFADVLPYGESSNWNHVYKRLIGYRAALPFDFDMFGYVCPEPEPVSA